MDTLKISSRHLSLDAPFSEGEDNNLLDVLEGFALLEVGCIASTVRSSGKTGGHWDRM